METQPAANGLLASAPRSFSSSIAFFICFPTIIIGKPLSAFNIEQIISVNPNLVKVNTSGFSAFDIQQFISAGAKVLIRQ